MKETEDQKKLRHWLAEYALWRCLDGGEGGGDELPPAEPDFAEEASPGDFQIRLWPPGRAAADPPLYGLLLFKGYGCWELIPFSVLSLPALPAEFRLRERGPAQVLAGWNRRRIDDAQAAQSWLVDVCAGEEAEQLRKWWIHLNDSESSLDFWRDRVGPPLRHPLDPRHEFLEAERARVDRGLGERAVSQFSPVVREELLSWAAQSGPAYGVARWRVGDTGVLLEADDQALWLDPAPDGWLEAQLDGAGGEQAVWRGNPLSFTRARQVDWQQLTVNGNTHRLHR